MTGKIPIFNNYIPHSFTDLNSLWTFWLVILSTLFVMSFYNLTVFLMWKKNRTPLFLGGFCILIFINILVSTFSSCFSTDLTDALPENFLHKIDIITIILSMPFFIQFLHAFFPAERSARTERIVWSLSAVFVISVIFAGNSSTNLLFRLFFTVILGMIIYSTNVAVKTLKKKYADAKPFFAGIILLSAAGLNDILWGMNILDTIVLVPTALVIFTFIYSVLVSRCFSRAFADSERLVHELGENNRLREEMQQRIRNEQNLRQTQRQLTALLHAVDNILCAVYSSGKIAFCNKAFQDYTGLAHETLYDTYLDDWFTFYTIGQKDNRRLTSEDFLAATATSMVTAEFRGHGKSNIRDCIKTALELEDDELQVLVFRTPGIDSQLGVSALAFIDALNRNRSRLQYIGDLMNAATPEMLITDKHLKNELRKIDMNLEQISALLVKDDLFEKKKLLCLEIMTLSLKYWTEAAGKSKTDLARESELWKIQINRDGWERTQTLDRYLDYNTFPKNPRWNTIIKTADFVLLSCTDQSPVRQKLETALQQFNILI